MADGATIAIRNDLEASIKIGAFLFDLFLRYSEHLESLFANRHLDRSNAEWRDLSRQISPFRCSSVEMTVDFLITTFLLILSVGSHRLKW